MRERVGGFALAVMMAGGAQAQAPDPVKIVGHWSGSGVLFEKALANRVGPLTVAVTIAEDQTGSGHMSSAALTVTRVRALRDRIEVRADLSGAPVSDPALAKRRLVLVVTSATDSTLMAEFHLKSNYLYDPTMREGRVLLTRVR